MVRLVITDFATKDDNEAFYTSDEFDVLQKVFTYDSFKRYSVYLSKYDTSDDIYSLNLLSKKYLPKNQFLIHIADGEYFILFNHKTVYSAKINQNFITDDMIKSILITKHIVLLSGGAEIEKIHYVINSKHRSAIENILKQNTRNEKGEVVAQTLGNIDELIKPLNELDNIKSHTFKNFVLIGFMASVLWVMVFGMEIFTKKVFYKQSLQNLKRQLKIEKRLVKRQEILLKSTMKKYTDLTACISKEEVKK